MASLSMALMKCTFGAVTLAKTYGLSCLTQSQKYGYDNPLFLRPVYREKLGQYMELARIDNATDATTGEFKGTYKTTE
jgi:hypothetical protein